MCEHVGHNEALSPLDLEAGIFFGALANALTDLNRKTLSRKPVFHLASGEALELWMLKVAVSIWPLTSVQGPGCVKTLENGSNYDFGAFFKKSLSMKSIA